MLTTKKQSITSRLAFYAKLVEKLDAVGQQLDILCECKGQAVTIEQLFAESQVYNLLQFSATESAHVQKRNDQAKSAEKVASESGANLNVYEKYLRIENQSNWKEWKRNLIRLFWQFLILFGSLIVALLVSAIWLSPAFRNQLHLIIIWFVSSFAQLIGLTEKEASAKNYCTLPLTNGLQSAFLPPFDCANCANLTKVAKVSNLDYRLFRDSYLNRLVPVVIQDATSQWTALDEFTVDFIKRLYSETEGSLNYHDQNCQFFPYKTSYLSLEDAFKNVSSESGFDWYIGWSNCDSRVANILRKYYQRPYFLPPDSLLTKTDWLFMGSVGYGAHLHIDNVGNPSWQAQVKGSKLWTIKPPYECLAECSTLEVQVDAGEIIVLDTNKWYHKTLIVGDEISITIGSEFD